MITTRLADLDKDWTDILKGAKDFVSRIDGCGAVPETDKEMDIALRRIVLIPGCEVVVSEKDGTIIAGIGMLYGPALWRPSLISATELFIWASEDAPAMAAFSAFRFVMKRIEFHGATIKEFVKLPSSPPSINKLFTSMGLKLAQETWVG